EAAEAVTRDERVDVRQRGGHAAGQRLEGRVGRERVDPHDAVRQSLQTFQLSAEQLRVAALEAVGADDDDRSPTATAPGVLTQELPDRLADPCPAVPVTDDLGGI